MQMNATQRTYLYWIGGATAIMTLFALLVGMFLSMGSWMAVLPLVGVFLGLIGAFIDVHSIQRN